MACLIRRKYKDPKTGKLKPVGKYYGQFVDALGITRRVPLATNRDAAKLMLADLVKKAELARGGVTDRFEEFRKLPVSQHLGDWKKALEAQGVSPAQVSLVTNRATWLFEEAKVVFLSDLVPSRVLSALDTKAEREGLSLQTKNFYLASVKQFSRWLARDGRLESSPLAHLKGWNVKLDRCHDRRPLSREEAGWLLWVTKEGPERFRVSGLDRHWLYRLALATGLRAGELCSLNRASFDIHGKSVTIQAAYSKNRRADTLPLPDHILQDLSEWLKDKPPKAPLWPANWAPSRIPGKVLKLDLGAARLAFTNEGWIPGNPDSLKEKERREKTDFLKWENDAGQFADFHSLRHSFVSWAVESGAAPKTVQRLARHSTISLTMDRYAATVGAFNLEAAVNDVPNPMFTRSREPGKATGTVGPIGTPIGTKLSQNPDFDRNRMTPKGMGNPKKGSSERPGKPGVSSKKQAEGEGFEPTDGLPRLRFSRPVQGLSIHCNYKELGRDKESVGSPIGTKPDLDLQEIIESWEILPDSVRQRVLAIARAIKPF